MKLKEAIKKFLNELVPVGPPGSPGSDGGRHHYHKHPKSNDGKGDFHAWGADEWPYTDTKADMRSEDEMENAAEGEIDKLPESSIKEFFKFTTSREDGKMGMGTGISQGSGAPRSYGKSKEPFGKKLNPEEDEPLFGDQEEWDTEKKLSMWSGRQKSRAQKMEPMGEDPLGLEEYARPGVRDSSPADGVFQTTKQPFASGGDWKKTPWGEPVDVEEEETKEIEKYLGEEYADSAYSSHMNNTKAVYSDEDLNTVMQWYANQDDEVDSEKEDD